MATAHDPEPATDHVEVLIVGAGLSGVGAAYRLQTLRPDTDYAIVEAREAIGGTWDLFRYPGIRSDSDMSTLGFPFDPWAEDEAIADGARIRDYIRKVAQTNGIVDRIRFDTKVIAASWSSDEAKWTVTLRAAGREQLMTCSFLYLCSGYYDYDRGHRPEWPGEHDFTGQIIHPQFWPDGLDVTGKRVVVIGSGATAVTLVPALAEAGAEVTMLQRTNSYVTALPKRDALGVAMRKVLPRQAAGTAVRYKNAALNAAFYQLARRRPELTKRILAKGATQGLGGDERAKAMVEEHFRPPYDPWDQRLCVAPDGDLYAALGAGRAHIVTDTIERFTADGLELSSGRTLEADIIVTATGLRLLMGGGIRLAVDGEDTVPGDLFVHRGTMLGGVPNLALSIGYVNASWTLRSDLVARYIARLLLHLDHLGARVATPTPPEGMTASPLLPVTSGYVMRAAGELPSQGDRAPWLMRQNYFADRRDMLRGDLDDDMTFS